MRAQAINHQFRLIAAVFLYAAPTTGSAQQFEITFDEVATQPVDGLTVENVTFDFKVGGVDSADAVFNFTPGPPGQSFSDSNILEGSAVGILTFDFAYSTPTLRFGIVFNNMVQSVGPDLTVDLFGVGLVPLGTIPVSLVSPGAGLFIEGEFVYPGGPDILRAVIDFDATMAGAPPRFIIDNLKFQRIIDPVIPQPEEAPAIVQSILLIDQAAIDSANTTGLHIPAMHNQALRNISKPALRDLNARLFRSRLRIPPPRSSTLESDYSIAKYLNFVSNLNLSDDYPAGAVVQGDIPVAQTLEVDFDRRHSANGALFSTCDKPDLDSLAAKNSLDAKCIVEPEDNWEVFASYDFGDFTQYDLNAVFRGFNMQSWAGTVGAEYRLSDSLMLGIAYSHVGADAESKFNLGGVDVDGNLYSAYATKLLGDSYIDVLYSFGDFSTDIVRRTLVPDTARANPDSFSHTVSVNAGHNIRHSENLTHGPVVGLDYLTGEVDGYTETGSPRANLIYDAYNFDSLIGRLGWQVTHHKKLDNVRMTSQLRMGWESEFRPNDAVINAALETSPFLLVTPGVGSTRIGGFQTSSEAAHPGQNWLALGGGVQFELEEDTSIFVDYQGHYFRRDAIQHFVSLKVSHSF